MAGLPGAVLFACSENAIRSPMASAIMKYLHGRSLFVMSAGVRAGSPDGFAIAALEEIGIDMAKHEPRAFDELDDDYFDLVISLSPEAHHHAVELTRDWVCEIEYWPTSDPSLVEGSREARLDAYRALRDELMARIRKRFPRPAAPRL